MIRIDFACNHPDNGHFRGRVVAVNWRRDGGSDGLNLIYDSSGLDLKFTVADDSRIRFLRRWWPYERSHAWVGNWCWDAYWFEPPVAKAMLRRMRASGKFLCDGGPAVFVRLVERA